MPYNCATQTQFPIKFCNVDSEGSCSAMNYAVSITPKFGAVLSLLGVSLIIYRFFNTPRNERKTHDRLMFGMSIMNFLGGLAFLMSQWPFPYIEPGVPSSSSFCNWQGWALQQQTSVFWYNSVLITVFVLKIRLGWHEEQVSKYEPLMHFVALIYPTITSFVALSLRMYGSAGPWCWIHVKYDWARWAFFYAILWPAMIYSTCCMLAIVKIVKKSDDRTQNLRSSRVIGMNIPKLGRQTRIVAVQAALYVITFVLTWAFGTANRLYGVYSLTTSTPCSLFGLMWLHSLCVPLQGFGNFLVYIYPRIRDARREAKLFAREHAAQNVVITRKEAFIGFCNGVYKVTFGVGPILSPSQIANDSDLTKESGTIERLSRYSAGEASTAKTPASPTNRAASPSFAPRLSSSASAPANFAFLGLGPSSSTPSVMDSNIQIVSMAPSVSAPTNSTSENEKNIAIIS